VVRWGAQAGSVYLADQKLPIRVSRVRDQQRQQERPLATYQALQTPRALDAGLFRRVLGGLSCREYAAAAEAVPEPCGLARSSVSRRFIRASTRQLQQLQERPLDDAEWLVLLVDGKTFAADALVIALGVAVTGEKRLLGLVQTATENRAVGASFLRELVERGFRARGDLLVVLDGGKGLRAAVQESSAPAPGSNAASGTSARTWCATSPSATSRRGGAGSRPRTRADLRGGQGRPRPPARGARPSKRSAAASLLKGLEETLTLHRLGLFPQLGISLKTTNLLESVMARVEARTAKVDRWRTSDQKLRWCAAALLAVEKQFRRVKGYTHLPLLERALAAKMQTTITPSTTAAA